MINFLFTCYKSIIHSCHFKRKKWPQITFLTASINEKFMCQSATCSTMLNTLHSIINEEQHKGCHNYLYLTTKVSSFSAMINTLLNKPINKWSEKLLCYQCSYWNNGMHMLQILIVIKRDVDQLRNQARSLTDAIIELVSYFCLYAHSTYFCSCISQTRPYIWI